MSELYEVADDLMEPHPNPDSMFGVDLNINHETIDDFLDIQDVVYADVRMLQDSAQWEKVGGNRDLTVAISGFSVIPFPYIAQIGELPVPGAYQGDCLFDVDWSDITSVAGVSPRYQESMQILEQLFPQDKTLFIMCGGGGYTGKLIALLKFLGWDPDVMYNVGAGWKYRGDNGIAVVTSNDDGCTTIDTSRIEVWQPDFASLTPIA